ncbi:hypothetical protein CKF46_36215, partial [Klebsiella pneumoniae]
LVSRPGWGFGFAPADYQQGESYRIMYLHVPAAMCRWGPWLAALSALLLVSRPGWGFGFAPADYQQGESYRIMYLHVPAA